jgi:hypothetical protein
METDKPISQFNEDKLRRDNFVKALVNQISKFEDKECCVIGLYGKWGSGKTSIIKLLEKELYKNNYFTAYFNPWRYKSEDTLLKELFLKILQGAQSDRKLESSIQELGNLLDEYSQYIAMPKISFWGLAFDFTSSLRGLGKGVGKLLKGNASFDAKKIRINHVLRQLALPLIIFIDDVDRLDVNEIQSVFKIVKLTADFNNLIYVIAFDEDIVSKALAKNYGNGDITDGKNFLEKIVQLPLRIPYVNEQERFEYTIGLLNDWGKKEEVDLPDKYQGAFVKHFRALHDCFIKTPRDSKRLLNSVSFSCQCLKNEVNVYDIILIETIRIFAPLILDELITFKPHLFSLSKGQDGSYAIRSQLDDVGKSFKEKTSQYVSVFPAIQGTIDFLFPSNKIFNVGWDTYMSERQDDLFKNQRVGIQKYFDRFIEFNIGAQDISDTEFKKILHKINVDDYQSLKMEVERLCSFSKQSIIQLLGQNKEQLTTVGKINAAKIFSIIEHFFSQTTFEDRFFNRSLWLSLELLCDLDADDRIDAFSFIVLNCEKVNYVSTLIHAAYKGFGSRNEMKFEPQSALDDIATTFIRKVQESPIENLFKNVDEEKNYTIFKQIDKYGNPDLLKLQIKNFLLQKQENVILVMKSLINLTYVNFSQKGSYSTEIENSCFEMIEKYIERKELSNICYSIFPDVRSTGVSAQELLYDNNIPIDKAIVIQYLKFATNN